MTVYSHTRLSAFEQCPLKYKYYYIDKIRGEMDSIEAFLGNRFHETMEKAYAERAFWKPTAAELQAYFNEIWDKSWSDSVAVIKKDRTPDDYRAIGLKALADYHARYAPFDSVRLLGTERRVFVDLDAEGKYKFTGNIDRLMEPEDGHFEIHDYKTAGSLPEQAKLDADRQLALYEVAIRTLWPDQVKDVDLIWHYVVFDKEMRSKRTPEQLNAIVADTIKLIDRIGATTEFPPCETALCRWCDYQDICPLFSHGVRTDALPVNEYMNEEGVVLVNQYADLDARKEVLNAEIKIIDREQAKIKDAAIALAVKEGYSCIYGSDKILKVSDDIHLTYPKKDADGYDDFVEGLKLLGLWESVTPVSWQSLKSIAKKAGWLNCLPEPLADVVTVEEQKTVRLTKKNGGE